MRNALSAQAAIGFLNAAVQGYIHRCPGACILDIPYLQVLYLVAYLNTAHAFDTFIAFPNQWKALIPWCIHDLFLIRKGGDTQIIAYFLQGTIPAS